VRHEITGVCYWKLNILKARAERRNWTELNWHGLVFDELTNGQAGRAHNQLVDAYVHAVIIVTDTIRRCPLLCITAYLLVSSSKTKPCQFGSVKLRRSVRASMNWCRLLQHGWERNCSECGSGGLLHPGGCTTRHVGAVSRCVTAQSQSLRRHAVNCIDPTLLAHHFQIMTRSLLCTACLYLMFFLSFRVFFCTWDLSFSMLLPHLTRFCYCPQKRRYVAVALFSAKPPNMRLVNRYTIAWWNFTRTCTRIGN